MATTDTEEFRAAVYNWNFPYRWGFLSDADLEGEVFDALCALSPAGTKEKFQAAYKAIEECRDVLVAARRKLFEQLGGHPAHLDCGYHPPCDIPGGDDCACTRSPRADRNADYRPRDSISTNEPFLF